MVQSTRISKGVFLLVHWTFIHGAASNHRTWSRQHRFPVDKWVPDLPTLTHSTPAHLINDLASWCASSLPEPSVIVGHSMGGAIAQTMALNYPNRVLALVLVGTGPHLPVNSELLDLLANQPQAALEKITRWSLSRAADPGLIKTSLELAVSIPPARALQEFTACQFFDVRHRLNDIKCPRFVIRGSDDKMTPEALSNQFLAAWPDVPGFTIPDAGHLMMLEQPVLFNDVLDTINSRL